MNWSRTGTSTLIYHTIPPCLPLDWRVGWFKPRGHWLPLFYLLIVLHRRFYYIWPSRAAVVRSTRLREVSSGCVLRRPLTRLSSIANPIIHAHQYGYGLNDSTRGVFGHKKPTTLCLKAPQIPASVQYSAKFGGVRLSMIEINLPAVLLVRVLL
ncbi:hypothetical protein B0H12DRAFT_691016 [Mycena haematopus]|nr:hypothetical protein B0H12DRAFT_691016 [Mycena haematopus]